MKKVSILIFTYNEEKNVIPLSQAIIEQMELLPQYDYEIVFIDNNSKDNTRELLRGICQNNCKVKSIFNAKNFGMHNSAFYGLLQTTGDCTILMCADFQDPVEMISSFLEEWEKGHKIVTAIKSKSKENKVMYFLRSLYYKLIKKMSAVEQIEHFTGFGLYDRSFIQVLRELKDPIPFIRGIVAELGFKRKDIEYTQEIRRTGQSNNNWYTLYDAAMLSFTSYTKIGLRMATFLGFFVSGISFLIALIYFVMKLLYWDTFSAGTAPILIGIFGIGGVQIFFIGLIGEYILTMNNRIMNRPLVIEEERINFETTVIQQPSND